LDPEEIAGILSDARVEERIRAAFDEHRLDGKRVLVIIPDNTRSAPVPLFFRLLHRIGRGRLKKLDFLVALGTHPLMSEGEIARRVGLTPEERSGLYGDTGIFNHRWDLKETYASIGGLGEDEIEKLSEGMLRERAEVCINKLIFDYDVLVLLGPVFPHEIAGFSGSNKYLFPGICAFEFTDVTHWLGALQTNLKTIGVRDTPVRRIIDKAAALVSVPIVYFNLVVDDEGLKGFFAGRDRSAWEQAVELSSRLNIRYVKRPFRRVLSIAPEKYDDFWTGAKAFYKIEPIVEDGGELIAYAPHITEISKTHGKHVDKAGFHVRDYFLAHWERYERVPRAVLAYSSLVKGAGLMRNGKEVPRVRLTLATGVPKERCERLNVGYMDPKEIRPKEWENREAEGIKIIRQAGEVLYRVDPDRAAGREAP
jgi:nickel-dependent lactate racemase